MFVLKWKTIGCCFLILASLSTISPQVMQLGHGLKITLPALAVAGIAITMASPKAFIYAFARFKMVFILGFLFILQVALRLFLEGNDADLLFQCYLFQYYVISATFVLVFLFYIAALTELGEDVVQQFRYGLLFCWCVSLAIGIPALVEHPLAARQVFSYYYQEEDYNLALYGIGGYANYASIGICFASLFNVSINRRGFKRWLALVLLGLASVSVLLSTFLMAAALLVFSTLAVIFVWRIKRRVSSVVLHVVIVLLLFWLFYFVYHSVSQLESFAFIESKIERLYTGISTYGFREGEDTTRAAMFLDDIKIFFDEPFFGYIPGVTGHKGAQHNSLSGSLLLSGVFGFLLWIIALLKVFRVSLSCTESLNSRRMLWISWSVLVLSGVINPTWHSSPILGALFAFTLPCRKNVPQRKTNEVGLRES